MAIGDVYRKIGGTWTYQGNIRGASGVAGALNDLSDVSGAPSTGDVLRKTAGDWQPALLGYADVGAAASGHAHSGYASDSHNHDADYDDLGQAASLVNNHESAFSHSQLHTHAATKRHVYTSDTTWTKTAGIRYIEVELVGGGGGSGGTGTTTSSQAAASGAGGSGGYARKIWTAADLADATWANVDVGAGGLAGTAGANAGGNGGTSLFELQGALAIVIDDIEATGGSGGNGSAGATNGVRSGGAGGTATGGVVGDAPLLISGSVGPPGFILDGDDVPSAFGPASMLSGTASTTLNAGATGTGRSYGGGAGSVRANASTGNQAGNAGGAGVVIVTEYY